MMNEDTSSRDRGGDHRYSYGELGRPMSYFTSSDSLHDKNSQHLARLRPGLGIYSLLFMSGRADPAQRAVFDFCVVWLGAILVHGLCATGAGLLFFVFW